MTFEEWEAKYKPISLVENELFSQDYAELKDPRCSDNCNNLWTVVEVDNGDWIISNGFHLVNRVGYILTEVIWEEEFLEVTYLLDEAALAENENARDLEVDRLRGEVSYLRACVTRPTDYGHEVWTAALRAEVAAERTAVVAWLRASVSPGFADDLYDGVRWRADEIENGEHRRKENE